MSLSVPPVTEPATPADLDGVTRALRALRPEEREVFLMWQNGGLTYEEIAGRSGRAVGIVKDQMRAALRKLRPALS